MAKQPAADEHTIPDLPPGVKLLHTFEGHVGAITSLAFDPHGEILASGSKDRTVKLWEVKSGKLLRSLTGHGLAVTSVAFWLLAVASGR